jgi:hypothetical protein
VAETAKTAAQQLGRRHINVNAIFVPAPASWRPTSTGRARRETAAAIAATGERALAIQVDMGSVQDIDRMVAEAIAELGRHPGERRDRAARRSERSAAARQRTRGHRRHGGVPGITGRAQRLGPILQRRWRPRSPDWNVARMELSEIRGNRCRIACPFPRCALRCMRATAAAPCPYINSPTSWRFPDASYAPLPPRRRNGQNNRAAVDQQQLRVIATVI